MSARHAKAGKKNRKWGRNKVFCLRYRLENRQHKNKMRKLRKHLKAFPKDMNAKRVLHELRKI